MTWAEADRPSFYRRLVRDTEGRWTPGLLAATPVCQLVALAVADDLTPANILDKINEVRVRKGQTPIKSRRK